MITKGGLFHQPKSNFSYGYNESTLHLRFRALKGEVKHAKCLIGDPFIWEEGGGGGNLEAAGAKGWKCATYKMIKEVSTEYHDYYFVEISGESKRSRYAFLIESEEEQVLFGERRIIDLQEGINDWVLSDISNFYCFPYLNAIDVLKVPEWTKSTIWYQVFPDRFSNGDVDTNPEHVSPWGTEPTGSNYMGGDIQGIMNQLDYLHDLGITGIHLCPLFKGDTNHKYQTTDYMSIDPMFGSNEIFKSFVDKAHGYGIKVMLDAVFNHVGINHPFFQDVVENGEKSIYKDWFCIHEFPIKRGGYETFATVDDMPKINLECEKAVEYFIEVGKFWIEEYNIDGWRLDVANEISHDFWKKFRTAIKALDSDVYIVGEVWHDGNPWVQGDQYDAVMHYPLTDACNRFFAKGSMSKDDFIHYTNQLLVNYQKNALESSYNILDSHDTSRFLFDAGEDERRLMLAYAFIFTHPGAPSIYYGDEIGMSGEQGMGKEFHRRCMNWDKSEWNMNVHQSIKELILLRKTFASLKSTSIKWFDTCNERVLMYQRGGIIVVMNTSQDKQQIELPEMLYGYTNIRNGDVVSTAISLNALDYSFYYVNEEEGSNSLEYMILCKRLHVA